MNMDFLKKLNKVEVVIGAVVFVLFVVGLYAVFNKDTYTFPYKNTEINSTEDEEKIEGTEESSVKTKSSGSSGTSNNKAVPSANFNPAGIFPSAQLISDGRVQDNSIGTYCWFPISVCADAFITDLAEVDPLMVRSGSPVKLQLNTNVTPLSMKAVLRKPVSSFEEYIENMSKLAVEQIQLSPNKETSFQLNVEPGEYILTISSVWQEGDVEFNFRVTIK